MIYDIFEGIATAENWGFFYGRKDFQNLFDELGNNKVQMFLDPVISTKNRTSSGNNTVDSVTYTGNFLLLLSSDIEEDYNTRYLNHIKPISETEIQLIEQSILCTGVATIDKWSETEVINVFDYNFDGLAINYSITIDA